MKHRGAERGSWEARFPSQVRPGVHMWSLGRGPEGFQSRRFRGGHSGRAQRAISGPPQGSLRREARSRGRSEQIEAVRLFPTSVQIWF